MVFRDIVAFYIVIRLIDESSMSIGLWWKYWWGKIEVRGGKLAPVALCQPQIPRGLAWDCTWPSAAICYQLMWRSPLCCENHTHSTNKLCGQGVELINITTCD